MAIEVRTIAHTTADFFAHSNYIELALIELGERDVFPHTGRRTQLQIEGVRNAVYPLVTGTFGGVDFLHSVVGEGKATSQVSSICKHLQYSSLRQNDPE
jgi:hypothetical protein